MSPIERLAIAAAVLAAGAAIGWTIRRWRQRTQNGSDADAGLAPGLVLITAPYCTRCASLRSRLAEAGIPFSAVEAPSHPGLVRRLEITTAPTLLRVDTSSRVIDRESKNFADDRLTGMAVTAD